MYDTYLHSTIIDCIFMFTIDKINLVQLLDMSMYKSCQKSIFRADVQNCQKSNFRADVPNCQKFIFRTNVKSCRKFIMYVWRLVVVCRR